MLIRNAELEGYAGNPWRGGGQLADVRLAGGRIAAIGRLDPADGERVIDAAGGALLPGLHDHHCHLFALAAARTSVFCGPPEVDGAEALARRLAQAPGSGWLRGTGYHESVAGDLGPDWLDRAWLDAHGPDRPIRVQHRGGRRWIVNSAALDLLLAGGASPPPRLDRARGHIDDGDEWLRARLTGQFPDLAPASADLARLGLTGLTEMTPSNDAAALACLAAQQDSGALRQRLVLAGRADLPASADPRLRVRYTKLHLHDARLPDYEATVGLVAASHAAGRPVAVHCVTLAELVFALAALREAGPLAGDRIEHASIAPDEQVAEIAALGLIVVTQPHFIAERGDAYLAAVDPADRPWLYRAAAFLNAGVPLAAGSDAPFGRPDPWAAMAAAVSRQTLAGQVIGASEALSPEAALALFLGHGEAPERQRTVAPGAPADLCLLDRGWAKARESLGAGLVRMTVGAGAVWFERKVANGSDHGHGSVTNPS
ncbi:amidohydrolase family protein [Novosphingobium bradum]|uniref:Amidohydrolase family protein n=1 Tax=Novosphingobium bradum TaxID=1737444 RepID=A0ABV7IUU3_9SPHN